MDIASIILLFLVFFVSSLVRSGLGFGDAIIAMPILVLSLGLTVAVPLIGITTFLLSGLLLIKERQSFKLKNIAPLLLPTLAGIPIGIYFLTEEYELVLNFLLGVFIVILSILSLLDLQIKKAKSPILFGFLAGVFGGAYNTPGSLIAVYANSQKWDLSTFKATLQGYFIFMEISIMIAHAIKGLWTQAVFQHLLFAIPVIFIGFITGIKLSNRLDEKKAQLYINIFLILIGGYIIIRSST